MWAGLWCERIWKVGCGSDLSAEDVDGTLRAVHVVATIWVDALASAVVLLTKRVYPDDGLIAPKVKGVPLSTQFLAGLV